jgi:hypothetical protein
MQSFACLVLAVMCRSAEGEWHQFLEALERQGSHNSDRAARTGAPGLSEMAHDLSGVAMDDRSKARQRRALMASDSSSLENSAPEVFIHASYQFHGPQMSCTMCKLVYRDRVSPAVTQLCDH